MLLHQLVYLRALAQERHFGRAATACGISSPPRSSSSRPSSPCRSCSAAGASRASRPRDCGWWNARRILADCDGLQQEVGEMRRGLSGHLRIGAIPTALSMVPRLTTPFHAQHPNVRLTVLSQTSQQIQRSIDNFEIDIGVTYLDNEPLTHVRTLPFYRERYVLVTPAEGPVGRRRRIAWSEGGGAAAVAADTRHAEPAHPERHLPRPGRRARGGDRDQFGRDPLGPFASGPLVRGHASDLFRALRPGRGLSAIPLGEPEVTHIISLATADRDPVLPVTRALLEIASAVGRQLPKNLAVA